MLIIQDFWILYMAVFLLCIVILNRRQILMNNIRRKRKGVKRKMPTEMMKEFIGKECVISLFNEVGGVKGTVLSVEENWIKVEEKKQIRIINGDMVRDIAMAKQID